MPRQRTDFVFAYHPRRNALAQFERWYKLHHGSNWSYTQGVVSYLRYVMLYVPVDTYMAIKDSLEREDRPCDFHLARYDQNCNPEISEILPKDYALVYGPYHKADEDYMEALALADRLLARPWYPSITVFHGE